MKNTFTLILAVLFLFLFNPLYSQDIYELIQQDRMANGPSYAVGVSDNAVAYGDGAILKIFALSGTGNPTLASQTELHALITDIVIKDNFLYVSVEEAGLLMYEISDPATPILHRSYASTEYEFQLEVMGQYVYLSDDLGKIMVIDMEDPQGPSLVTEMDIMYEAEELILRGDRLIAIVYDNTFIFDVSNPTQPIELVHMQNKSFSDGDIISNTLYLSDHDTLHIFDITDISQPELVHKFDSGTTRLIKFEIVGDYVYAVGTNGRYTIYEMGPDYAFDFIGHSTEGGYFIDLVVVGTNAYIVGVRAGLIRMDNTDRTNPIIDFADENASFVYGLDIKGDVCYIANEYDGLQIYDIDGANNFVKVGGLTFPFEAAYQVEVEGNIAYVARRSEGLSIVNVNDRSAPVEIASLELDGRTYDVEVRGNLLYMAQDDVGMHVVDVSDPASPEVIGTLSIPGNVFNLDVHGSYAYVASGTEGLHIVDISDPTDPQLASVYNDGIIPDILVGRSRDVFISDNTAYLADFGEGFHIINVTDKENPMPISHESDYGNGTSIQVKENILYLGRYLEGISIFDISDPLNIRELDTYDTGSRVEDIALSGDHILVNDYACGFYLFDLLMTTSTEDIAMDRLVHFDIFPNPTTETFSIGMNLKQSAAVRISLLDTEGRLLQNLYEGTMLGRQQILDFQGNVLNNLSTGIYFINVNVENDQMSKAIFIQH